MKFLRTVLKKEDGFALLEVTIALIIMGIVMSVGIPSFLKHLRWQKIQETKEKQEKILYSVAGFVLQNGFIPLPADPQGASENFGIAREFAKSSKEMRGLVPFKTLGLPESYAKDGFKRYFTYIGGTLKKEENIAPTTFFCQANPFYPLKVDERGIDGHLSKRSALLSAQSPVVLVLLSHGESGSGAYTGNLGRMQKNCNSVMSRDKQQNASFSLDIINRSFSPSPQDFFDDIVVWVTRENLMAFYGKSPCQPREMGDEQGSGYAVL